jgi:predicted HicB family RNase H-like nuclease
MAEREDVIWMQLATRIPKSLHQRLRVHCVEEETSLMAFVAQAIRERLAQPSRAASRARRRAGVAAR